MDFVKVLKQLSELLEGQKHRYGGHRCGVGLAGYGMSRATVDLVLVLDALAQAEMVHFLESRGYETLYRSTGYSNRSAGSWRWALSWQATL